MKKSIVTLSALVCLSTTAQAKNYLSFDLGKATKAEVEQQLKTHAAAFSGNYGYQGYSQDLPIVKVLEYKNFSKYGAVKEAWLHFTPKKVLYKISVTYQDAGNVIKLFKDSLDSKYGSQALRGGGFNQTANYHDGKVNIALQRNTFGFGSDQKTTLTYTFTPAISEVKSMEKRIEDHIAQKNASQAADL